MWAACPRMHSHVCLCLSLITRFSLNSLLGILRYYWLPWPIRCPSLAVNGRHCNRWHPNGLPGYPHSLPVASSSDPTPPTMLRNCISLPLPPRGSWSSNLGTRPHKSAFPAFNIAPLRSLMDEDRSPFVWYDSNIRSWQNHSHNPNGKHSKELNAKQICAHPHEFRMSGFSK